MSEADKRIRSLRAYGINNLRTLAARDANSITMPVSYARDAVAEIDELRTALEQIREMAAGRATTGGPGNAWQAVEALADAALVVVVLDATQPLNDEEQRLLAAVQGRPTLLALNKKDAGIHELRLLIQRHPRTPEAASARTKLNGLGVRVVATK